MAISDLNVNVTLDDESAAAIEAALIEAFAKGYASAKKHALIAVGMVPTAYTTHGDDWTYRDGAIVKRDCMAAIEALEAEG